MGYDGVLSDDHCYEGYKEPEVEENKAVVVEE